MKRRTYSHAIRPVRAAAAIGLLLLLLVVGAGRGVTPASAAHGTAPQVTSAEVSQSPAQGSTVVINSLMTYTATVVLSAGQAGAMTIQLASPNVASPQLTCSKTNPVGPADVIGAFGSPSCMWQQGHVTSGTYTFTYTARVAGPMTGDPVPNAASVVCTDTNHSNTCDAGEDSVPLQDNVGPDVGPVTVTAQAPPATSEVTQTPAGGSTVPIGTHVTYTAVVTINSVRAPDLSIHIKADPNIGTRTITCTSSSNGVAPTSSVSGSAPGCKWDGATQPGTFTVVFEGNITGSIGDAVPDPLSVACNDTNNNNDCTDEDLNNRVPLMDGNNDVGPLTIGAATGPNATSEVDQTPAGGATVPVGTLVTYTVHVTLNANQAQSLTIQLKGDANVTNRTISCTSNSNPNAGTVGINGPDCMWTGPVNAGTFTMTWGGTATASIGDAVPHALSVICIDSNSSNTCNDEPAGNVLALADANGDVGPLTVGAAAGPPAVTSEVSQSPIAGSTVPVGTHVTYTAVVTLSAPLTFPLTIQLAPDANIASRAITCTSSSNGSAGSTSINGASCMWASPVAVGTFTMVWEGNVTGPVGDAVPNVRSVVCTDSTTSNTCDDEPVANQVPLADANGDVGPLTVAGGGAPAATSEVTQSPVGGSTVAAGTHVTYTVVVTVTAGQAQAMTIQLHGDGGIINRSLTCTSTGNGNAGSTVISGNPSCMWAGPIFAGTFTLTFAGDVSASIGDAVPDTTSVVCTDSNASGTCSDEPAANVLQLADANGDVGVLTVGAVHYKASIPLVASDGVNR